MANFAALAGVMLNALELMAVSPPAVARKIKPPPILSMLKLLKLAVPAIAETVAVPLKVAEPEGSVCMAMVIEFVAAVTELSLASRTCTVTTGLIVAAARASMGCCT